ncbi:MAG: spore germination protein [Alicyclobacillus sp.]|nr:spore germination protein [Alicyclobacillus sp.]
MRRQLRQPRQPRRSRPILATRAVSGKSSGQGTHSDIQGKTQPPAPPAETDAAAFAAEAGDGPLSTPVPDVLAADHERLLERSLSDNLHALRQALAGSPDMVMHTLTNGSLDMAVIYVESLADVQAIHQDVLIPLHQAATSELRVGLAAGLEDWARVHVPMALRGQVDGVASAVAAVLRGDALLLVEGCSGGVVLRAAKHKERAIAEPDTEALIRGPREGFVETLATNLSLLRRRLPTAALIVETHTLGGYTRTQVALCYLEGLAPQPLVDEVRQRLARIQLDGALDSAYLEEWLEDHPFFPFPQIQNTERPDTTAAALLEGKVALLMEGSPFALIGPVNLWGALQAAEDYYERYLVVTLIRSIRFLFLLFALFLPATYVAISTFHQEMLPTKLLLSVAAAREVTPLPAVLECLLMEISFEALREAGVRLPRIVGQAISIVGALVIGQAAVQAGMASAPMVIIVSITGIASFTIPRYNFAVAIRMLRFPMIILAGTLGLFGIVLGGLLVLAHLCSLRSFGQPYLQPVTPLVWSGLRDVLVRAPHWLQPVRQSKVRRWWREEAPRG